MRQWKSLVPALHLHAPAASCFPHPPSPSPCPSPPRGDDATTTPPPPPPHLQAVRLVGCDGRVRAYAPPVTARELMQAHPRHLVCRADALLIGEKIPAVAAAEELRPGDAYFLLPAHLFRSALSFVPLASSLLLVLSAASAAGAGKRPFELHRTPAGTLQIKFSDDFLLPAGDAAPAPTKRSQPAAALLRGDDRLAKDYEELVGYAKSRRWAPKLDTIDEVPAPAAAADQPGPAPPGAGRGRRSRALPFLGRLGSRRRRDDACSAVACSG
ncbi:uncharacterized protein [Zea mays]|jgi:hypothetical protein|uniref:DUF4228 domain protein n=1 Tax=Zea mays TaxID=4577 RepID=A0A1D6F6A1_MAIZE|nr:uncharacterized protein LOC103648039 [Zea mays]ONM26797.1 hypothetical protein ZEAMMB73_Zm00001d007420 [Zea mays]|eukprot:XP_008670767.1 uncharacterized protein LOC103648039 [Zea mays]